MARLWHAATLLREHRGDGHFAALVAEGIGGTQAHVLHALSQGWPLWRGLAFFITGISGSMLHDARSSPPTCPSTLSNLMEHGSLARIGVVLELGIVLTQAVTAVWF